MEVIKKINNNAVVCRDSGGRELVAFGKGIGFPQTPYQLTDMSQVSRTYYDMNPDNLYLFNEIPEDIFEIAAKITDYASRKIMAELNPNIIFTLADHIHFALQRYEQKMYLRMPLSCDIKHLHEIEMEVGEKAVRYINRVKKVRLPADEAACIAMHFINAEDNRATADDERSVEKTIQYITDMIEAHFAIKINKEGFNYSRFVTHMHYLLKRTNKDIYIASDNGRIFENIREEYPDNYACALQIRQFLQEHLEWYCNDEELLYLMLHINRLCEREDCNQ